MSRIGRQPVPIPSGVDVKLEKQHIHVKGPKGELSFDIPEPITVREDQSQLLVERPNDNRKIRSLHGTTRSVINSLVVGVSSGFERKLQINGVGYRASVQGNTLTLELGYSHPIKYDLPEGITAEVERNVEITLRGYDKQLLGEVAAKVRSFRPPEPYKGKGVKYIEEHIRRKVGKKNV